MGRAYLTGATHPAQNFAPGFTCAPQEVQNFALGAAGGSEGFCTSGAAGDAAGAGAGATTGAGAVFVATAFVTTRAVLKDSRVVKPG